MLVHGCHIYLANMPFVVRPYVVLSSSRSRFCVLRKAMSYSFQVMTTPYITRNRTLNPCYEKACFCSLSYSAKVASESDSNLGYSPVIQSTTFQHMLKGRYTFTRTRKYTYIPVEATASAAVATFTLSTSLATAVAILSTSFLMANVVSEV